MTPQQPTPATRVESVNWLELLPFTRLFSSFTMAIDPPKLLLSLLLVVLLFLTGKLLDAVWGGQVFENEIMMYAAAGSSAGFERQLHELVEWREAARDRGADLQPLEGVFSAALRFKLESFDMLVSAATSLNFGFAQLVGGAPPAGPTVVAALYRMFVVLPGWMWAAHPWFFAVYALIALALWGLIGGAVCRLIGAQATTARALDPMEALAFARGQWPWFFVTPLLPILIAGGLMLLLAVGGLVFFNLPVLDVLGALVFGLALMLGLIAALLLIGFAAGVHLMYPALAIEGTDGFDAVSRSFNYVFGRPWRWLFYTLVALVYGAITYLFVGLVIFLTVWLTHKGAGWWVFAEVAQQGGEAVNRLDAMLTPPRLGELMYAIQWDKLPPSGKAAAGIMWVWVVLLLALLPAYAISFYFTSHTWIYLLLRRSADGTDLAEFYVEPAPSSSPAPASGAGSAAPAPPPATEGSVEAPPPPNA